MSGEKISQNTEQEPSQITEWDKLVESSVDDIEEARQMGAGMVRRVMGLPKPVEMMRRNAARFFAPNTMPSIEQLVADTSMRGLWKVEELCRNWPLFSETRKVVIDGTEVDFPRFRPEIVYKGGMDFTGYLSTPESPEQRYKKIRSEIGKKTASIYLEACLDNPLVSTLEFEVFSGTHNSDYVCFHSREDGLNKARVRLIDESVPLDTRLQNLNARMAGVEYVGNIKEPEKVEAADTVERAMIAYHEIGHATDFWMRYMGLNYERKISNDDILEAVAMHNRERANQIDCSATIPQIAIDKPSKLSEHELWSILERRGFDPSRVYTNQHLEAYNARRYREMPCEAVADSYARRSVCVRHRDHYFAQNEAERRSKPGKKGLPIYGEYIYMGDSSNERELKFLDQELINCGIIAGKEVTLYLDSLPKGARVNPKTRAVELPDDYDYMADVERQNQQEVLAVGTIKQNPSRGNFEVIDKNGNVIAIFGGQYRRQLNIVGDVQIVNGGLDDGMPNYRLQISDTREGENLKTSKQQYGSAAFNAALDIDTTKEHCILFINDNGMARAILPKGGFTSKEKLVDETGEMYDMPQSLFMCGGIPKVRLFGQLYEIVIGSDEDLQRIKEKIK